MDPDVEDAFDVVALASEGLATGALVGLGVSQLAFQLSSEIFWSMVNLDQLIFFAPLMSLRLPPNLFVGLRVLRFSVGDLFFLEWAFTGLFGPWLDALPESPFSPNFAAHGR